MKSMNMPNLQAQFVDDSRKIMPAWAKHYRELVNHVNAEMAPGRIQAFYLLESDLTDSSKFVQSGANAGLGVGNYLGWALCNGNNGTSAEHLYAVASEGLHVVGDTGEPAYENSWVAYGAGYSVGSFVKIGSRVHLAGLLKNGTAANALMFTLPTTHRPNTTKLITAHSYANTCVDLRVASSGSVYAFAGGSTTWTSLDGCNFDVPHSDPTLYNLMRVT